jgi:hypothetical protein
MRSSLSPVRPLESSDEVDQLLNDPDVLEELGRLADEADADGGTGDIDGEKFCREFMAETLLMAAAKGVSIA